MPKSLIEWRAQVFAKHYLVESVALKKSPFQGQYLDRWLKIFSQQLHFFAVYTLCPFCRHSYQAANGGNCQAALYRQYTLLLYIEEFCYHFQQVYYTLDHFLLMMIKTPVHPSIGALPLTQQKLFQKQRISFYTVPIAWFTLFKMCNISPKGCYSEAMLFKLLRHT